MKHFWLRYGCIQRYFRISSAKELLQKTENKMENRFGIKGISLWFSTRMKTSFFNGNILTIFYHQGKNKNVGVVFCISLMFQIIMLHIINLYNCILFRIILIMMCVIYMMWGACQRRFLSNLILISAQIFLTCLAQEWHV